MDLNQALTELAKPSVGPARAMIVKSITRSGGLTVRLAVGEEGRLHRYVFDGPFGPEAFDADAEDLAATDWELSSAPRIAPPAAPPPAAPDTSESKPAKK